ncbi:MAG: serine hydrolase domain-containing protein [Isosphaeraceae bacterium]
MKHVFFSLALLALLHPLAHAGDLPRSSPEAQGVSSAAVLEFVEAADRNIEYMNSFMLVRHGHVVAEGWWAPYDARSRHSLYSLSKSFTSTAVGLAISEGKLSLDDEVLKFFPDDAPAQPSKNLQAMRVHDLLRMSTGHVTEPARTPTEPWTKTFLKHEVPFKPGTHFLYNTSGTYMLSAIVQKATGKTVLDYLKPRLFEPLGIEDPTWETSPQGISAGGYGLSIRTEDIAKFGQLYLQKGGWGRGMFSGGAGVSYAKRPVPVAWVEAATSRQTSNGSNPKSDWDQGYGYQFWRCRHGAYRGDGAFGQYCIVMPEQDAVVAITSGVKNMQAVLDLVWDKLLPAFKRDMQPKNEEAHQKLVSKLASLSLPLVAGSGKPAEVVGKRFTFAPNPAKLEALVLDRGDGGDTLVLRSAGKDHQITCGHGQWQKGRLPMPMLGEQPAAASGGWTADNTYNARVCFTETPFLLTLTLKFSGNEVTVNSETNVGFGSTKRPPLVGKVE